MLLPAVLVGCVTCLWARYWPCNLTQALAAPAMAWLAPEYASLVQPFEPSVRSAVRHIRTLEPRSMGQARLAAQLSERLIWYRRDADAHGAVDIAMSPTRMQAAMRAGRWPAMQGDCDDRAVYAASLAAALGIPYRFAESPTHAWAEVFVNGSWRSILANDSPGAAPDIGPWQPGSAAPAVRDAIAQRASLAWVRDLPVDPQRNRAYPPRLGWTGIMLLSGLTSSATGILLQARYRRAIPRLIPV